MVASAVPLISIFDPLGLLPVLTTLNGRVGLPLELRDVDCFKSSHEAELVLLDHFVIQTSFLILSDHLALLSRLSVRSASLLEQFDD